jgi:hypothetical protein
MRIFLTSKFAVLKTSDVMYGIVGSVNTTLSGVFKSQKTFPLLRTTEILEFNQIPIEVVSSNSFEVVCKPEAGSLNKSSCLAPTLGVANVIIVTDIILVTLYCAS